MTTSGGAAQAIGTTLPAATVNPVIFEDVRVAGQKNTIFRGMFPKFLPVVIAIVITRATGQTGFGQEGVVYKSMRGGDAVITERFTWDMPSLDRFLIVD